MKTIIVALTFTLFTATVSAQDSPSFKLPRAVIKISPLQFVLQTFELGVETFNKTYSRSFNLSAGVRTGADYYEKGVGAGVEIGYRKYAAPMKFRSRNNRDSYQGIYYGLFVKGEYFKGEDPYYGSNASDDYSEKILSVSTGLTIGFQKTLWQILLLDVYVGGGYKFSDIDVTGYLSQPDWDTDQGIFGPGYTGVYPKMGVKIGIGL